MKVKKKQTAKQIVEAGKKWKLLFEVDAEVAVKLIFEHNNSPTGTQFAYLVNKHLKKAYNIKTK